MPVIDGPRARRSALVAVALTGVLAVLARLPLMGLPLDPDEGGYALIARRWASGAQLYTDGAWVDRPPGLLLVFRLAGDIAYSPTGLRVVAMVPAVVVTLAAASAAWALAGRLAAVVTGVLTAVVLAGPYVEGYQLNGELIAAAVASCAVALSLWWRRSALGSGWLVVVGLLAASAPLVKQSAVDGLVVVVAVAAASARRRRALPLVLLGVAVPLVGLGVAAAAGGWHRWWYALVGFQAQVSQGQPWDRRLGSLAVGLMQIAPDMVGLTLAAVMGVMLWWDARRLVWPALLWAAVAVLAAVTGPFAHPHYWVQAVGPLAVLAGLAAARLGALPANGRALVAAVLALSLLTPVVGQAYVVAHPADARAALLSTDHRFAADGQVAAWLRAHTAPGEQVYAFVAAAELYLLADRGTTYPYLWYDSVRRVPGAAERLREWLASPQAPAYLVMYNQPGEVDPSGRLRLVLKQQYAKVASVAGYDVLEHRVRLAG